MVSPAKTVVMTMFFFRADRLRGFQLMRHHRNSLGRKRAIKYPPRCISNCLSYKRRLSSSDNLSPSDEDTMGISPELQSCILKFVNDGSLSQEESSSISAAMFRSPFGRNLVTSRSTEEMKGVIQYSIDSYLTQRAKRAESGRGSIGNPGSYVRSIVKTEVSNRSGGTAAAGEIKNAEEIDNQMKELSTSPIDRQNAIGVQELRELLRLNWVQPNELSENCMHVLSQHSALSVRYALETYAKQKKRREENNIDKIANPSSYIMAVLRNTADDIEKQSSAISNARSLHQSGDQNPARSLTEEIQHMQHLVVPGVVEPAQEVTSENSIAELRTLDENQMAKETNSAQVASSSMHANDSVVTIDHPETPADIVNSENKGRQVTMEYVDKCLELLQKLEQPVVSLPGVGPKTEQALNMLGLFTLRDLLWHFPRSFVDRSILQSDIRNIANGELGTFVLTVHRDKAQHNAVPCSDEVGNVVDIVFVYGKSRQGSAIAAAAKTKLLQCDKMIISGKVTSSENRYSIFNPDVIELINNATEVLGIEPVYRLNSGLTQNKLVKIIDVALEVAEKLKILPESLPDDVLEDLGWPSFVDAIKTAHRPATMAEAGVESPARNRLAFEELCMQQARLALARWDMKHLGNDKERDSKVSTWRDSPLVTKAVQSLPFQLTDSQMHCLDEIWNDAIVRNDGRMTRLLQGDVGSGKTVLGYLTGLGCIESRQGGGSVAAILAPTQLLALQHFQTISGFANAFNEQSADTPINNIRVELLTGSVVGSKREEVLSRLENTDCPDAVFLIGTHALVATDVVERLRNLRSVYQSNGRGLALSIVDEEQRFGVNQRQALSSCAANTLFMSATPIPRSLGLAASGLLDVTHLESEPRNVQTTITTADNLYRVISVLQTRVENGSKCFWVLPRIGGNETEKEDSSSGSSSVLDRHSMLADIFGTETVGHVHGRMSTKDRETQLAKFSDSSSPTSILVSTTVIEVGIDIKSIDILIVENADRFGLAALHQLRGRIGRGDTDVNCHCILIAEERHFNAGSSTSLKRLDILRETMSGEQVSAADFMLRGPGDLMGKAQSGLFQGKAVNPEYHWEMMGAATRIGRAFSGDHPKDLEEIEPSESQSNSHNSNSLLMRKLSRGELRSFYDQTNASYEKGFALRVMMTLFADYNSQQDVGGGIMESITLLQRMTEAKNEISSNDDLVQQKFVSLLQSFPDPRNTAVVKSIESKQDETEFETPTTGVDDSSSAPVTRHIEVPLSVSTHKVNMAGDNVVFIVLDVETTGLSAKHDHVIQIAAKVLGSTEAEDLFSEYILPPVEVPEKIEELTGIKDSFLRYGGYDDALGKQRDGPARVFADVFLDFQLFCKDRAQGKKLVLVAHNARFDKGMLNGELRRLRTSESSQDSLASSLSDVFDSSLDSLELFRDRRMWKLSIKTDGRLNRPDSFKLGSIYHHVFSEMLPNSHNAVGDIQALDRLLMEHNTFYGWKNLANDIQSPMSKVHMNMKH